MQQLDVYLEELKLRSLELRDLMEEPPLSPQEQRIYLAALEEREAT